MQDQQLRLALTSEMVGRCFSKVFRAHGMRLAPASRADFETCLMEFTMAVGIVQRGEAFIGDL
jgi:hypothetical protein